MENKETTHYLDCEDFNSNRIWYAVNKATQVKDHKFYRKEDAQNFINNGVLPHSDYNRLLGEMKEETINLISILKHGYEDLMNHCVDMGFIKIDDKTDGYEEYEQTMKLTGNFLDKISELSNLETAVPNKVEQELQFEIFTNWAAKKGYIFHAGMWFIGSEDDDTTFLTSELFTLWKGEKK